MSYVRVVVQECKPGTIDKLSRDAEQTFVPRLRQIPGFVSYRVAKIDDRSLIAIGVLQTREGAQELERLGAEWRKQHGKDAIVSSRPYVGEVILEATGTPYEARPSL